MSKYKGQDRFLLAIDCIIFGFDGSNIKLLLVHRDIEPEKDKWSLMGGFVHADETPDDAANRILEELTGLKSVYMEQMQAFGALNRDPVERTVSIAYYALIDIHKYEQQLSHKHHAEWFLVGDMPDLIFDHSDMVKMAKKRLQYKAALHPILFQLLPEKFTIPQLQALYEGIYQSKLDDRNFSRKLLSTGLLIKLPEKEKLSSKKGAFYYTLDQSHYMENFHSFLNFIPNPDRFFKD
ncbi:ADP-ribose pyrophosphatase YjhB (NUDIX family) [Mucilaginibacter yixingensis]|uniref:ADP-ribose pyrophosphatase YjhB (NUDIX family) n=1 Tax=Mucilaginibacter yixingensis TaxID=1295612 RepID=A0A2T5JFM1_9SPHI|nr:NUDIX hydrolase [Mucilaginibacter yixingensis]PTR01231.1 ADP-ribose pyrophosphatase YjhB (NUDIX family) [Mucilaginibacter yixingensis]